MTVVGNSSVFSYGIPTKQLFVGNCRRKIDEISREKLSVKRAFLSVQYVEFCRKFVGNYWQISEEHFWPLQILWIFWYPTNFWQVIQNIPTEFRRLFFTVLEPFKFFKFPTEFRRLVRRKCRHLFYKYELLSFTSFTLNSLHPLHSLHSTNLKKSFLQIIFVRGWINIIWIQTPTYLRKNMQKALLNSWHLFNNNQKQIPAC